MHISEKYFTNPSFTTPLPPLPSPPPLPRKSSQSSGNQSKISFFCLLTLTTSKTLSGIWVDRNAPFKAELPAAYFSGLRWPLCPLCKCRSRMWLPYQILNYFLTFTEHGPALLIWIATALPLLWGLLVYPSSLSNAKNLKKSHFYLGRAGWSIHVSTSFRFER